MSRFLTVSVIVTITVIAIVVGVSQFRGCDSRFLMIDSLAFTPDDSLVTVAKVAVEDDQTAFKRYFINPVRTVSQLAVINGTLQTILQEDFEPGTQGILRRWSYPGRMSVCTSPASGLVAVTAFDGNEVTYGAGRWNSKVIHLEHGPHNITFSSSGRYLAASGNCEVSILDTSTGKIVTRIALPEGDPPFIEASFISFADDEIRIVIASAQDVSMWNILTGTKEATIVDGGAHGFYAMAVAPNDTLVLCTYDGVKRYDFTGRIVATLGQAPRKLCCLSADRSRLAVYGHPHLEVYNLKSNVLQMTFAKRDVTAIALSSDGSQMAVGDELGQVSLLNLKDGTRKWRSSPPIHDAK